MTKQQVWPWWKEKHIATIPLTLISTITIIVILCIASPEILSSRNNIGVLAFSTWKANRFGATRQHRAYYHSTLDSPQILGPLTLVNTYGRGAEIWPPTNENPIKLEDSFPYGQVPDVVNQMLKQGDGRKNQMQKRTEDRRGRLRTMLTPRSLINIITQSTVVDDFASESSTSTNSQKFIIFQRSFGYAPFACAVSLLAAGFCRPLDVLLVILLSGYTWLLGVLSQSITFSESSSISRPTLPSLPPQGHVPVIVSNPLGYKWTNSVNYDRWLMLGVVLDIVGPIVLMLYGVILGLQTNASDIYKLTNGGARPLFFVACQAVTEESCRRFALPLPIRILVPVAYNTVRLGYLWQWMTTQLASISQIHIPPASMLGRGLATACFFYTFLNLFAFLLPVAVMKYMRAHFFAVEADQVSLRPGMEETIGLA